MEWFHIIIILQLIKYTLNTRCLCASVLFCVKINDPKENIGVLKLNSNSRKSPIVQSRNSIPYNFKSAKRKLQNNTALEKTKTRSHDK